MRRSAHHRCRLAPALAALAACALGAVAPAAEGGAPSPGTAAVKAQALAAEARAARARQEWARAADAYRAALVIDPALAEAREGLAEVEAASAGQPIPGRPSPELGDLRRQAALAEARAAIERAEVLAATGRHGEALERLMEARGRLQPFTGTGEADRELARVGALAEAARASEASARAAASADGRARAREQAEAAREAETRQVRSVFAERLARIRALEERQLVQLALEHARALAIDHPGEAEAEAAYERLLAKVHEQRRREIGERDVELRERVMERLHESLLPSGFDGEPIFPRDFADRHAGYVEVGTEGTSYEPWQARLLDSLAGRISVDFENMPIDEALAWVAGRGGFNLVVDPSLFVGGARVVTLRAADLRIDQCLNWLGRLTGAAWVVANGAVYFGGDQRQETVLAVYDLANVVTAPYDQPGLTIGFTAGGDAGGAANIFTDAADTRGEAPSAEDVVDVIRRAVSPQTWEQDGNVIEIRGNVLYVTAPKSVHHLLAEFIRSQSYARAILVHVAARWLTVSDVYLEEIGVDWGAATNLLAVGTPQGFPAGLTYRNQQTQQVGNVINVLPGSAVSAQPPGAGGLTLSALQLGRHQLSAVLTAVERKGDARILASPELTTANGVRSSAFFGNQYAYIADYEVVSGNLDPVIEVLTVGASLDIKPYVSADRKYVSMEFRPAFADVSFFTELILAPRLAGGGGGAGGGGAIIGIFAYPIELPNVALREVSTTVMVPDGGTLMVGGFGRHIDQNASAKVPFLGHIPFLGRLFGKRGRYSERTQLYLLATVDIITYQEAEENL